MANNYENKLNVEPMLNQIGNIIKNGITTVINDYMVEYLTCELEKNEKLCLYYRNELENIKNNKEKSQQNIIENNIIQNIPPVENILLNITEQMDNLQNNIDIPSNLELINKLIFSKNVVVQSLEHNNLIKKIILQSSNKNNTEDVKVEDLESCEEEVEEIEEEVEETEEEEEVDMEEEEVDVKEEDVGVEEEEVEVEEEEVDVEEEVEVEEEEVEEETEEDEKETEEDEEETEEDVEETEEETEEMEEETEEDAEETEEVEEEEEEVEEYEYEGITYFVTNANNGIIFENNDDEPGVKIGELKNGIPNFY